MPAQGGKRMFAVPSVKGRKGPGAAIRRGRAKGRFVRVVGDHFEQSSERLSKTTSVAQNLTP